jgi:hypothetical protein
MYCRNIFDLTNKIYILYQTTERNPIFVYSQYGFLKKIKFIADIKIKLTEIFSEFEKKKKYQENLRKSSFFTFLTKHRDTIVNTLYFAANQIKKCIASTL